MFCLNLNTTRYMPSVLGRKLYSTHCPEVCHLSPPMVLRTVLEVSVGEFIAPALSSTG
jgi:hypothetical protein